MLCHVIRTHFYHIESNFCRIEIINLIRCESNPLIMGRHFRRDNCKVFCLLILTLFTFDMLIRKYTNHIGINILQHISTCKQ